MTHLSYLDIIFFMASRRRQGQGINSELPVHDGDGAMRTQKVSFYNALAIGREVALSWATMNEGRGNLEEGRDLCWRRCVVVATQFGFSSLHHGAETFHISRKQGPCPVMRS